MNAQCLAMLACLAACTPPREAAEPSRGPAPAPAPPEAAPAEVDSISSAPSEVRAWVAEHAIPLATVEAGHGFDDLAPLKAVVGDARVVALGESTHGTREFFQLKHRMLEFLVTQLGFTVFAIEANMPEAYAIDDYVVHGKGDAATALAGIHFWTWNTEEVLAMIEWMRAYNADPTHEKKVRFYGFDMQSAPRAAAVALAYLGEVDDRALKRTRDTIAPLLDAFVLDQPIDWTTPQWQKVKAGVAALARRFDDERTRFIARSDEGRFELARQHVRVLEQWLVMVTAEGNGYYDARDRAMAANAEWLLAHEPPGTKMVIWAHNGHVEARGSWFHPMGEHLRKTFGDAMVVFGFAFHRGGFTAYDSETRKLRAFEVGPAHRDSLDAMLATADSPAFALDLRALPKVGRAQAWLTSLQPGRSIGAVFADAQEPAFYEQQVVPDRYDALLFVEATTASRPLPTSSSGAATPNATASNLDFETGDLGAVPPPWIARRRSAAYGFHTESTEASAFAGKRSATVHRHGPIVAATGGISQKIEAGPYLARRIELHAATRAVLDGPTDHAYLWIEVDVGASAPPSSGGTKFVRIDHRKWREQTITIDVSKHATAIAFGIALVGEGQAWIDEVALVDANK